jgi:hypothetical protein
LSSAHAAQATRRTAPFPNGDVLVIDARSATSDLARCDLRKKLSKISQKVCD